MPDPRDQLDLSSTGADSTARAVPLPLHPSGAAPSAAGAGKPFLRLWFRCSAQYARAYRKPDGSCYLGRCPACGQSIRFPIGPGGTGERSFVVSCAD